MVQHPEPQFYIFYVWYSNIRFHDSLILHSESVVSNEVYRIKKELKQFLMVLLILFGLFSANVILCDLQWCGVDSWNTGIFTSARDPTNWPNTCLPLPTSFNSVFFFFETFHLFLVHSLVFFFGIVFYLKRFSLWI